MFQFFGGVIFFACIAKFIPEPTLGPSTDVKRRKVRITMFSQGFLSKNMRLYVSWMTALLICWLQKNGDEGGKDMAKKHRRQVLYSGIVTAIGIPTFTSISLIYWSFVEFRSLGAFSLICNLMARWIYNDSSKPLHQCRLANLSSSYLAN